MMIESADKLSMIESFVERIKIDILNDIKNGIVPRSISGFCELHDYVDANCYGSAESLLEDLISFYGSDDDAYDKSLNMHCELCNAAIPMIDSWILNGMPAV